ncbi:hypothetical protein [Stenotrophomonas phage StenR_269]|nr:hypothetical protein [Stenotrophomonas phage StenR_269]
MKISLVNSVLCYVGSNMPNLLDYIDANGKVGEGSNAYRFGMREGQEIRDVIAAFPTPNGKRQSFEVNRVQALVIRDRIEFAYEIASDNAADGDRDAGRMAVYYRSAIKHIDEQLAN